MTLPAGFRANAEREAARLRKSMGLKPNAQLDVHDLAEHLRVKVVSADKLIDLEQLEELERIQTFSFSAATFNVNNRSFIVTNPLRHKGRQASDIAHELAHILLKHDLTEVRELNGLPFRTCKPDEEEQATSFGGTILLPRLILMAAAKRGLTIEQIAAEYEVTIDMARFRYNTTGVAKQTQRRSN